MNTMVDEQRTDTARRSHSGPNRTRLVAPPRPGQRLSAAGLIGGLLPGMILGLVVGLRTGSFLIAAGVGLVAVAIGGLVGARIADDDAVDTENPSVY